MSDHPKNAREEVARTIQEKAELDATRDDGETSLLIGFVVVAEWARSDGTRWLSMMDSDAAGAPIVSWQKNGYLYEALHTDWPTGDDDEDE